MLVSVQCRDIRASAATRDKVRECVRSKSTGRGGSITHTVVASSHADIDVSYFFSFPNNDEEEV